MRPFRLWSSLALITVLALVLAACGSSSNKDSSGAKATTTVPKVTPVVIKNTVPTGAKRLHFKSGPYNIIPGQNDIGYNRSIPQPTADGYIVGISTNLEYADGSIPPVDVIHLHHGVWLNTSAPDATSPGLPERFFAAGEEKTRMILPAGYGYPFKTTDHWLLNYMLHNLLSKPDKVWVTYDVDFVPANTAAAKGLKPARAIWMDVQNGSIYPVFDVVPQAGHDTYTYPDDATDPYGTGPKKNEWTVDTNGTLIATAGHLHPGGLHNDLWLDRAGQKRAHLYESTAHYFEPAGNVSWDVAMTATPDSWRVAVKKGDVMSTSVTYDSKTAAWYESMGIMVVWMVDGDTTGVDPFTKAVDAPGVLDARAPRRERQPRRRARSAELSGHDEAAVEGRAVGHSAADCRLRVRRRHERRASRARGEARRIARVQEQRRLAAHPAHDHRVQAAVRPVDGHCLSARERQPAVRFG